LLQASQFKNTNTSFANINVN